ncbi:hypothetical protein SAMN05216558_2439 [Pseudomonas vancouverensis]|nr:hypothetical protein SAMN05216558_2439 [Pseudomonas vancouverensis]
MCLRWSARVWLDRFFRLDLDLDLAAFGPTRFWVEWVHIRCCGNGGLGFRPYGESLLANAPKGTKRSSPSVRPSPWLGSLRSGIHPGASPTVCFAAPPLDAFDCVERSLRSHPRINPSTQPAEGAGRSKAAVELTLILLSGEKRVVCAGLALALALLLRFCGSELARDDGLTATLFLTDAPPSVGASMLAKNVGTIGASRHPASSLTSIANKFAPTGKRVHTTIRPAGRPPRMLLRCTPHREAERRFCAVGNPAWMLG